MNETDGDICVEQLMAEPKLVELCELQRIGDEVLDVISLSENQHSDILAWMLDAKEGHGQGDEILRDLLVSASTIAASEQCKLDGKFKTAKFFKSWPPSRMRTTSFGAAFAARELGIKAAERVDLFVIDAQNKFILVIENKAGSAHNKKQLDLYRNSFSLLVSQNSRLKEYDYAFIAIDREFDVEAEEERPSSKTWLHIGYDWLETSAKRALLHVARGNSAAKLVVSYCNRQTAWEDPGNRMATDLAASLHQAYPEAVTRILKVSGGRLEKRWLNQIADDPAILFLLQNKGVISLLKETRGMAAVQAAILAQLTTIAKDSIYYTRVWLFLCPRGWEVFRGKAGWPVYLTVRAVGDSKSLYTLALCWYAPSAMNAKVSDELRSRLSSVDSRFAKYVDSKWRRVAIARAAPLPELVKAVVDVEGRLFKVLTVSQPTLLHQH